MNGKQKIEAYCVWGLSRMKSTEGLVDGNAKCRTQNAERRTQTKKRMF